MAELQYELPPKEEIMRMLSEKGILINEHLNFLTIPYPDPNVIPNIGQFVEVGNLVKVATIKHGKEFADKLVQLISSIIMLENPRSL